MSWKSRISITVLATAIAGAAFTGQASAQVLTGWVGTTATHGGLPYLHTSAIDNGAVPKATTRIYTSFGTSAPANTMGAMARLFREGALCSATDYLYNSVASNQRSTSVARDCGSGWYNSHGFVAVNTADGPVSYVTFPTDPLQYTAPLSSASRALAHPDARATGVTSEGMTYGSAEGTNDEAKQPDLISTIGDNGTFGYVKSSDLTIDFTSGQEGPREIPVYALIGNQPVDTFTVN